MFLYRQKLLNCLCLGHLLLRNKVDSLLEGWQIGTPQHKQNQNKEKSFERQVLTVVVKPPRMSIAHRSQYPYSNYSRSPG